MYRKKEPRSMYVCLEKKGEWTMDMDQNGKDWEQQPEKTSSLWKDMTNNGLIAIAAKRDQFVGILQKKSNVAKEGARRQVDALKTIIEQLKNPVGS